MTVLDVAITAILLVPLVCLLRRRGRKAAYRRDLLRRRQYCKTHRKHLIRSIKKLSKQGMGPLKTIEKELDKRL